MDSSMDSPQFVEEMTTLGTQILVTKFIFIALFAMFLYDYCLTFSDEVQYIWKRKFSIVTLLFIMNRYYTMFAMCVILSAFFSPLYTPEVCSRFALFFPFGVGMPLIVMSGIVMGLRVHALYDRSVLVAAFLATYLVAEFVVAAWAESFHGNHPLEIPQPVRGLEAFQICIDETADTLGNAKSAIFQFMETIYDTIIFGMTIWKTVTAFKSSKRGDIIFLIAKHGLVYFAVIFSANLLWAMLILFAPTGLKYSTSMPTVMLVCTMVNRMTIDLRAYTSNGKVRLTSAVRGASGIRTYRPAPTVLTDLDKGTISLAPRFASNLGGITFDGVPNWDEYIEMEEYQDVGFGPYDCPLNQTFTFRSTREEV